MVSSFDKECEVLENQTSMEALLAMDVFKFDREELLYTSGYCEENIYMLCLEVKKKKPQLLEHCSVMFISNDKKAVGFLLFYDTNPAVVVYIFIIRYHYGSKLQVEKKIIL
jgi:hypothetical protein